MAMGAAAAVRREGVAVDMVLEAKKRKWVLKHANRIGVGYAAIFDSREADRGLVRVKCLANGEASVCLDSALPPSAPTHCDPCIGPN